MDFILNIKLWIASSIFLGIMLIGMIIIIYLIFKRTHVKTEIKAVFTGTPLAIYFQDNKFADIKPATPINGILNDKQYGPYIVGVTYVDRKTRNIIIPVCVDMDGDRTVNIKEMVEQYKNVTNNEKSISELRTAISSKNIVLDANTKNLVSYIKFGTLKDLFLYSAPHNIKSKVEKIVSERIMKYSNVDPIQAVIVFGAIFGLITIATILLKIMGISA